MAFHALKRSVLIAVVALLSACSKPVIEPAPRPVPEPTPVVEDVDPGSFEAEPTPITPVSTPEPTAEPTIAPSPAAVLIEAPDAPALTAAGRALIYDFEVGGRSGYNPHPEAPDARLSGVTWGIGYDAHQNSKKAILTDWSALGAKPSQRLAATQPYYGGSAQAHLRDVRDILVSWQQASDVFERIDVGREFAAANRLWPGFSDLRPNAQAALISQGFNRGWSTLGANRTEMREMRRLTPLKNYSGIATQMRKSVRVWAGTSIYNGMRRRRLAEAKLVETP